MGSFYDNNGKLVDARIGIAGRDIASGGSVGEVSFEKDVNGYYVLRFVDAAPFAYDITTDSKKIKSVDRNVQEIAGHNNLSIRDTANQNTVQLDVSKVSGRKNIMVISTLNQAVDIKLYVYTSGGGGAVVAVGQTVPANTIKLITATEYPILNEPIYKLLIQATCTVAPTTGLLTTWINGVQA